VEKHLHAPEKKLREKATLSSEVFGDKVLLMSFKSKITRRIVV
jgi:hypothetical protein